MNNTLVDDITYLNYRQIPQGTNALKVLDIADMEQVEVKQVVKFLKMHGTKCGNTHVVSRAKFERLKQNGITEEYFKECRRRCAARRAKKSSD